MSDNTLKTRIILRNDDKFAWQDAQAVTLLKGEVGIEWQDDDTAKIKIGDGTKKYSELPYFGGDSVKIDPEKGNGLVSGDTGLGLELATDASAGAMAALDKKFFDGVLANQVEKYSIGSVFEDTRINITDKLIRVMFAEDTPWFDQGGPENPSKQKDTYYFSVKFYAPNKKVTGFREDGDTTIKDTKIYHFTPDDFGGVDEYGRKYSIVWMPAARKEDGVWKYFGDQSTADRAVGWYHTIEWLDESEKVVASETVRIELTNKDCHNALGTNLILVVDGEGNTITGASYNPLSRVLTLTKDATYLTAAEIEAKIQEKLSDLGTIFIFKGTKNSYGELLLVEEKDIGDVYQVTEDDVSVLYAWDGDSWASLGEDLFNLPLANETTPGLIKGSDGDNKISLTEGIGEVNNVTVDKLKDAEGVTLILNGGAAIEE